MRINEPVATPATLLNRAMVSAPADGTVRERKR